MHSRPFSDRKGGSQTAQGQLPLHPSYSFWAPAVVISGLPSEVQGQFYPSASATRPIADGEYTLP